MGVSVKSLPHKARLGTEPASLRTTACCECLPPQIVVPLCVKAEDGLKPLRLREATDRIAGSACAPFGIACGATGVSARARWSHKKIVLGNVNDLVLLGRSLGTLFAKAVDDIFGRSENPSTCGWRGVRRVGSAEVRGCSGVLRGSSRLPTLACLAGLRWRNGECFGVITIC